MASCRCPRKWFYRTSANGMKIDFVSLKIICYKVISGEIEEKEKRKSLVETGTSFRFSPSVIGTNFLGYLHVLNFTYSRGRILAISEQISEFCKNLALLGFKRFICNLSRN